MMVIGSLLIIGVDDIFNLIIYVCYLILGIGIAGQFILVNFLKFRYSTSENRGKVYGIG